SEQVVSKSRPGRDVFVTGHARRLWNHDRLRQETRRPFRLLREPAGGMVEAERSLKGQSASGVLILDEDRMPRPLCIVHPRRDVLGQLVRYAVGESVREVLAVVVPGPNVAQVRALVANLDALAPGDVRGGGAPAVRPGIVLAVVL